jgi:hypothetical protein
MCLCHEFVIANSGVVLKETEWSDGASLLFRFASYEGLWLLRNHC